MDRKILERKAEFYNKQVGRKFPCSNQIVSCGVITDDKDKAIAIMEEKGATMGWQSVKNRIEWMLDNEKWIWRNWNESAKSFRFYKVIVDKNIDESVFHHIEPLLANYCCSFEIV